MKTKLLIIAIAALALAGCDDYEVAQQNADHYCEMVLAGYWPDYNKQAENCPNGGEVIKL